MSFLVIFIPTTATQQKTLVAILPQVYNTECTKVLYNKSVPHNMQ